MITEAVFSFLIDLDSKPSSKYAYNWLQNFILKIFQVWSWGFVVRSVVGMLAALDAKKGLHLGLHIRRKASDFPPEPCRQVLYCCWPVHSGFCSIHRSLLDWSLSSLEHFVSTSSYVTCKQRPLFFSLLPRAHMRLSRLTLSPHFVFILKCLILPITCFFGCEPQRCWPVQVLPPSLPLTHNSWSCFRAFACAGPSTTPDFIVCLTLTPLQQRRFLRAVLFKSLDSANKCPL